MDKLSVFSSLQKSIDTLKSTECSQKEKVTHFGNISDSIVSIRAGSAGTNFQHHLGVAIGTLLMFCEETDSGVRMSAEENLNRIVRFCEGNGGIVRVQIDLYHEIKKNGNEKSLRICLALFGHYCGAIKQRKGKTYAQNLLPCIYAISKRKETQLLESLAAFVKIFAETLECFMTDGEVLKMTEVFVEDLASECASKRRCAAQNIDSFIAWSRCPEFYANNAFNRCIEMLLKNQDQNAILGVLTCFRGILPVMLKKSSVEKSIEILDLVLYFLKDGSHSVINAALEVVSVILVNLSPASRKVLLSVGLEHRRFLLKRKTLKNSVFKINLTESLLSSRKSSTDARMDSLKPESRGAMSFLQVTSTPTKFTPGDDKSLASVSDFEMDSFRSMEFENSSPEKEQKCKPGSQADSVSLKSQKSTDSLGSFINTFLTTSSSAGESVSKFFRKSFDSPSSGTGHGAGREVDLLRRTEEDDLSLESLASSQISMQSSTTETIRNELDVTLEVDDSLATSGMETVTLCEAMEQEDVTEAGEVRTETPTASIMGAMQDIDEPADSPSREIFIGLIHDQNIIDYMVRLIASKFLLSGLKFGLIPDYTVRVSVKNMSLLIISQCVQLRPEVLLLSLEKDEPREEFDVVEILSLEDAINEISNESILELDESPPSCGGAAAATDAETEGLLDIKEDHFGECTSTYFEYFSPMSISLDQGLTSLKTKLKVVEENFSTMASDSQDKLSKELDAILSQSDCSGEVARRGERRTELLVVPKVITSNGDVVTRRLECGRGEDQQAIADVLLFYDHTDQMLRGNVLLIVGNFLKAALEQNGSIETFISIHDRKEVLGDFLRQDALLQVVAQGLTDEIHTVVNQALVAFEQIFTIYCRCQPLEPCTNKIQKSTSDFSFKAPASKNLFKDKDPPSKVDPELLIKKLLLVFHNKYWLVQCKVCDVIVNLDFTILRAVSGNESARIVQDKCLNQVLLLLRDNDFRVRNHAGDKLISYIENISDHGVQRVPPKEDGIIQSFVKDYVLASFAEPIDKRRLQTPRNAKSFAKNAAHILYTLSNRLLNIADRNQLLGIINFLKTFISKYNPFDLVEVFNEFNLLNVLLSLMSEHTGTALDLTAQNDLLEICSTLMIVTMSGRVFSSMDNEVIDKFIFHVLKILNIYQHLFTNTKPISISRAQKGDLFMNAKELQLINCFGYFGNDHFYLKLYSLLRNSFESYKITITANVGQKPFVLLRTTIASLWRLLEIKNITTMTNGFKFIEEVLRYLMTFLPYEAEHCVRCTKFLLRFLFTCNYVNRTQDVAYFRKASGSLTLGDSDACRIFLERYYEFCKCKTISSTSDLGSFIKQFEQMVIACLKIYSKTTIRVQTAILDLLCQLLDYSINYQLLDSSNVFVECIFKHVELLETGTIQSSEQLIGKIVKFLFLLSHSKDRTKIINIPKIINICDNLLANGMIRSTALASLQALAHEIFFFNQMIAVEQDNEVVKAEIATQKEVVLNMMIKFPEEIRCYEIVPMVLLAGRQSQPGKYEGEILNALVGAMLEGKLVVGCDQERLIVGRTLEALGKDELLESKSLQNFLKFLFGLNKNKDISVCQKMIFWQLILEKVLLNSEEGYLLNHMQLFLSKDQTFEANSVGGEAFVKALNDVLYESIQIYRDRTKNDFLTTCLLQMIQTVGELRRFPTICKMLRNNINLDRLYLHSDDLLVRLAIQKLLVGYGYDMKKLLMIVTKPFDTVHNEQMVTELIGYLIQFKHTKTHWSSGDITFLIDHHITTLLNNFETFLVQYVSMVEYASAIVSKITNHLIRTKPNIKLFNLLEKSHLSSLPLCLDRLSNLLLDDNIVISRKSALVLDSKFDTLLKTDPLEKDYLHQVLPEKQFHQLYNSFSPERRKKFPKLFKSLLSLIRFYDGLKLPQDLVPQIDIQQLKQLMVDEIWFMEQINFHCSSNSYTKPKNISRMMFEVNSESKLISLLSDGGFNIRLLREVIGTAFENMFHAFRVDCVQFNPHLNYLKVHPMLKVALIVLMRKLDEINNAPEDEWDDIISLQCVKSVICFLENLNRMEHLCLIYVEARFIDRFIKDHILKSNFFETLLIFARNCAKSLKSKIKTSSLEDTTSLELYLKCIELILRQKYLWAELNQNDKRRDDQELYVRLIFDILKEHLQENLFLERYRSPQVFAGLITHKYDQVEVYLQAILIAQYISERDTMEREVGQRQQLLLRTVESVAVAVLKTDRFYTFAMTPSVVFNCHSFEVEVEPLQLPPVPIDYLYELDTLEVYLKRVNIFGYSSKQQFEELFMSLLVLINREGDPDMINYQEQHEIRNMCLRAITELLLTCYKYPRIGFCGSKFHHVPRNPVIKSSSVGLKKLHNIQLLIPLNNIFYQPNLERKLLVSDVEELHSAGDNAFGTQTFGRNQFSIRYSWHAMESMVNESLVAKNLKYFIERANLDVMSSVQLIYDVIGQLMEDNFSLALPHLVPFCEICENRDQIRQLYTLVLGLQERVAMEDTLSQQHIIFLLCKMAALLVPNLAELAHLCTIIPTYLKSTQLYIRDATLSGLICLLECLVTSNTTMGGLSEELQMLRNLVVNYIIKHGIIDESSTAFSDTHTKLVWTLNFYLIENTSRFVTDCNLLSNSIISANNILKRTTNLEIYLCVLNGLERLVLTNTTPRPLMEKIEKLALDLVKQDNEMFSLAALKLLVTCIYHSSSDQLENTERSNGIVQDEPEIIIQQIEKIEILFAKIRTTTPQGAKIFGDVLCQLIRDLLPPNEILTKVFKELMLNQPNPDIIATVTHQVFRSAIDSSYLPLLQEWLLCSLPNFLSFPQINKSVWCLTVIFLSASLNQHLLKLFPEVLSLPSYQQLNEREVNHFILSAKDFYRKLEPSQKSKFKEVFQQSDSFVYQSLLLCL